jgi:phage shock protein PspC (stress-responsive transcriptional regulator)
MNTVIVVNLNGIAFHIEEPGFHSLRAYLDAAQSQLKDNPDRVEIMADLEQAVADKFAHYLKPHKNVVTVPEIDCVIKEMGPVQSDEAAASAQPGAPRDGAQQRRVPSADPATRRLYQIREGAMMSGVCTGLAAYLRVDVTVVRVAFVVLVPLTGGLWILAYGVMMFVIPFANTDEEHAAATGAPFNAQEVIDRAKKHYAAFKSGAEWRRHWRRQRREWRRRWMDGAYWWGHNLQRHVYQVSQPGGYVSQVLAGLMIPLLAIVSVALFCVFITALVALATTGAILGWVVVGSMPLWVAILALCILYGAVASPLRYARRAFYISRGGYHREWFAVWDHLFSLGLLVFIGWLAYAHIPQVHDFLQNLPSNVQIMWNNVVIDSFHHPGADKPT